MLETDFNIAFLVAVSLASFGLWLIVGWAKISQRVRDAVNGAPIPVLGDPLPFSTVKHSRFYWRTIRLRKLIITILECPTCFGTWTGIGFGIWFGAGLPYGIRVGAILWFACMLAASNTILAACIHSYLYPPTNEE